ncbi:uncharacterized protein A1O5_10102 [Cladophialophora psammophila CBS 110553]|uniref:Uncharacterized protein n=1 Tax=Cladophialophora psammophila CBS 110553 TaxID=1182543 RepID=W9WFN3_9EURO|nr:uncharacterized protein A1O5_10102 [Cladophialophora psammophila CBS 110553]EXJ66907.1 hypothetical protein A1O5_10102 [Cladophialophora psammophila CBS 110553]
MKQVQKCITARTEKILYEELFYDRFQDAQACWLAPTDGKVFFKPFDDQRRVDQYVSANATNALIASLMGGHYDIAKTLLRTGFDSPNGRELLISSITEACLLDRRLHKPSDVDPHLELIKTMIEICAGVAGLKVHLGEALVLRAGLSWGAVDQVVRQLCDCGVDPNALPDFAETTSEFGSALIAASQGHSVKVVDTLLKANADPNQEATFGRLRTPLIAAVTKYARHGADAQLEIFKLLLNHGASPRKIVSSALQSQTSSPPQSRVASGSALIAAASAKCYPQPPYAAKIFEILETYRVLEDVNLCIPSDHFGTPLIAAAASGNAWTVDFLVQHGADPHLQGRADVDWCLPALAAVYGGLPEVALQFLKESDFASLQTHPQQWAKCFILVCANATNDAQEEDERALTSWDSLACELLDHGIDVILNASHSSACDDGTLIDDSDHLDPAFYGCSLIAACVSGRLALVKRILDSGAPQRPGSKGLFGSCLAAASYSANVKMVRFFLDQGFDVNEQTPQVKFWCPLVAALRSEHWETFDVVSLLLEKGADPNALYAGHSPSVEDTQILVMILEQMKSWHHVLVLQRLWNKNKITGSSIMQARPFFGSPITAGIRRHREKLLSCLMDNGGNLDLENSAGFYPTAMLTTQDNKRGFDIQRGLLDQGASPTKPEQMLDYIRPFRDIKCPHLEASACLCVPGSFWGNMLSLCVMKELTIPYLLQQGADPDEVVPGSFYGSAMITAAAPLRAEAVVTFLDNGSITKLNDVVSDGAFGTPLIAACAGPPEFPFKYAFHKQHEFLDPKNWEVIQFDLIEILLDAGANPNLTYKCFSPLIMLVCSTSKKKSRAVRLLLERGADPALVVPKYGCGETTFPELSGSDGDGWTAISVAAERGESKIVEMMKQHVANLHSET